MFAEPSESRVTTPTPSLVAGRGELSDMLGGTQHGLASSDSDSADTPRQGSVPAFCAAIKAQGSRRRSTGSSPRRRDTSTGGSRRSATEDNYRIPKLPQPARGNLMSTSVERQSIVNQPATTSTEDKYNFPVRDIRLKDKDNKLESTIHFTVRPKTGTREERVAASRGELRERAAAAQVKPKEGATNTPGEIKDEWRPAPTRSQKYPEKTHPERGDYALPPPQGRSRRDRSPSDRRRHSPHERHRRRTPSPTRRHFSSRHRHSAGYTDRSHERDDSRRRRDRRRSPSVERRTERRISLPEGAHRGDVDMRRPAEQPRHDDRHVHTLQRSAVESKSPPRIGVEEKRKISHTEEETKRTERRKTSKNEQAVFTGRPAERTQINPIQQQETQGATASVGRPSTPSSRPSTASSSRSSVASSTPSSRSKIQVSGVPSRLGYHGYLVKNWKEPATRFLLRKCIADWVKKAIMRPPVAYDDFSAGTPPLSTLQDFVPTEGKDTLLRRRLQFPWIRLPIISP